LEAQTVNGKASSVLQKMQGRHSNVERKVSALSGNLPQLPYHGENLFLETLEWQLSKVAQAQHCSK
jgi:hypothetical protein